MATDIVNALCVERRRARRRYVRPLCILRRMPALTFRSRYLVQQLLRTEEGIQYLTDFIQAMEQARAAL